MTKRANVYRIGSMNVPSFLPRCVIAKIAEHLPYNRVIVNGLNYAGARETGEDYSVAIVGDKDRALTRDEVIGLRGLLMHKVNGGLNPREVHSDDIAGDEVMELRGQLEAYRQTIGHNIDVQERRAA